MNGDESDNLILRYLRDLREHIDSRFSRVDARFDEVDVRSVKIESRLSDVEGLARTTLTEIIALSRRVEHIETGLRVAERLAAVERRLAEIEKQRPS